MKKKTARTIVMRDGGRWRDKSTVNGFYYSKFVYSRRRLPVFKVLRKIDNRSTHQVFMWPLPLRNRPGAWIECGAGSLEICSNGLHLTTQPTCWGNSKHHNVYLAEYEVLKRFPRRDDKFCVRRARLLRRVTWEESDRLIRAARKVK